MHFWVSLLGLVAAGFMAGFCGGAGGGCTGVRVWVWFHGGVRPRVCLVWWVG